MSFENCPSFSTHSLLFSRISYDESMKNTGKIHISLNSILLAHSCHYLAPTTVSRFGILTATQKGKNQFAVNAARNRRIHFVLCELLKTNNINPSHRIVFCIESRKTPNNEYDFGENCGYRVRGMCKTIFIYVNSDDDVIEVMSSIFSFNKIPTPKIYGLSSENDKFLYSFAFTMNRWLVRSETRPPPAIWVC